MVNEKSIKAMIIVIIVLNVFTIIGTTGKSLGFVLGLNYSTLFWMVAFLMYFTFKKDQN